MKKRNISEKTKVTLTIGQLKRLVKESIKSRKTLREARRGYYDEGDEELEEFWNECCELAAAQPHNPVLQVWDEHGVDLVEADLGFYGEQEVSYLDGTSVTVSTSMEDMATQAYEALGGDASDPQAVTDVVCSIYDELLSEADEDKPEPEDECSKRPARLRRESIKRAHATVRSRRK